MKLVEHFEKDRQEWLEHHLKRAESVEHVVSIVQDELKRLGDIAGEYIDKLSSPQARIALKMLALLRESFSTLTTVRLQEVSQSASDSPDSQAKSSDEPIHDSRVGRVVPEKFKEFVRPIGREVKRMAPKEVVDWMDRAPRWSPFDKDTELARPSEHSDEPKLEVDIETLLSNLHQALERIDETLETYGDKAKEATPKPTLEDLPELMEFLQNLMGDAHDEQEKLPPFTHKRIKELRPILRHYGIEMKVYQASEEQMSEMDAWGIFEFEPSLDPEIKEYVTLKPAFIKDGQVLLPGRVIEPVSSETLS